MTYPSKGGRGLSRPCASRAWLWRLGAERVGQEAAHGEPGRMGPCGRDSEQAPLGAHATRTVLRRPPPRRLGLCPGPVLTWHVRPAYLAPSLRFSWTPK